MGNFIKSMLEDNSSGVSSTRVVFFAWCIGILAIWAYTSIKSGQISKLDESIQVILGILIAGKVGQRAVEKPEIKPDENPNPIS